jgi:hypothetical protein
MATARKTAADFAGGYKFPERTTGYGAITKRLLGSAVVDPKRGYILGSNAYNFPGFLAEGPRPLAQRLAAASDRGESHYGAYLADLGDVQPGKTSFGRTRTGVTGIPAVDNAIFEVQDAISDLKMAQTIQTTAAVFSLLGIGWLILRGK